MTARRAPARGQNMVLLALTMLFLALMVTITIGLGLRIRQNHELQNVADAAAYSNAVVTARAFNNAALLNRLEVSFYVSQAADQSLISWTSYGRAMFGAAAEGAHQIAGTRLPECEANNDEADALADAIEAERAALFRGWEGAVRSQIVEAVAGIHTIKALVLEPLFLARGRKALARQRADQFAEARIAADLDVAGRALQAASVVAMLAIGSVLTLQGDSTAGRMVAAVGIFGAAMAPLNGLLRSREALREARAAYAHLASVLSLDTEDAGTTTVAPVLQGHVVFKQVSFRYPGALEDALTDVSLDVLPGQTVALVGRSGSGKTTLFNLLMGLYPPTRGTIFLDQIDLGSIPKADLRRQLGVVEQHPYLFEGTVRENIASSDPSAPAERIEAAARMAGAHAFITALPDGYHTRIGGRGATLSGGERQRLVIARALVGRPRMLLLDEATSAIDSRMERAIHGEIRSAQDRRTILVIAHRLSTVRNADLIVVLDQGRVIETGSHTELMQRRGLYWYLNTRAA